MLLREPLPCKFSALMCPFRDFPPFLLLYLTLRSAALRRQHGLLSFYVMGLLSHLKFGGGYISLLERKGSEEMTL